MNDREKQLIKDTREELVEVANKLLEFGAALGVLDSYDGAKEDALNALKAMLRDGYGEWLDSDNLAAILTGEGLPEPDHIPYADMDDFQKSLCDKIFGAG